MCTYTCTPTVYKRSERGDSILLRSRFPPASFVYFILKAEATVPEAVVRMVLVEKGDEVPVAMMAPEKMNGVTFFMNNNLCTSVFESSLTTLRSDN